jgi:hypothetical protein
MNPDDHAFFRRLRRCVPFCAAFLVGFAAAGGRAFGAEAKAPEKVSAGWAAGVDFYEVVPRYMGDGLEMAVVPTPREVAYSGKLFAFEKAAIVLPAAYDHRSTLRDLAELFPTAERTRARVWKAVKADLVVVVGGPEVNPASKDMLERLGADVMTPNRMPIGYAREGYTLVVTTDGARTVAVLAGAKPAGDFWAAQTLRQLLFDKDGKRYVHGVWIADWPTFTARGSKEMREYMPRYKDNFAWGGRPSGRTMNLVENFGWYIPYFAPGASLDCSEAYLDHLARAFEDNYRKAGMKKFAVKFDDVGARLAAGFALKSYQVTGLREFSEKIMAERVDEARPPSPARRVWRLMPAALRTSINRKQFGGRFNRNALAALNKMLARADFAAGVDFAEVKLLPEAAKLRGDGAKGLAAEEIVRLNRMALAAAFPEHFLPPAAQDTAKRFGTYGEAICFFMRELDKRAKALDPECGLYYMPQNYSGSGKGKLADEIRAAGGLPKDTGLAWCGPGVFSPRLPVANITGYMEAFGCAETKGIIYDNYSRSSAALGNKTGYGDYWPLPRAGHSPELAKYLIGVFSENADRLNRITRSDWNWNPEAYDEARSMKLAVREVAGPAAYKPLLAFLEHLERVNPRRVMAQSNKLYTHDQASLSHEKFAELVAIENELLPPLLTELEAKLPATKANARLVGELGKLIEARKKLGEMVLLVKKHARTAEVRTADGAIAIDGVPDEAAWAKAEELSDFFKYKSEELAAAKTTARLLYGDKNLYVSVVMEAPEFEGEVVKGVLSGNDSTDYAGRFHMFRPKYKEVLSMFLDTTTDPGEGRLFFNIDPEGNRADVNWLDSKLGAKSGKYDSGWTVKAARGGGKWSMEAAIPLERIALTPARPGAKWLVNFYRRTPDGQSTWALSMDASNPNYFGTLVFK